MKKLTHDTAPATVGLVKRVRSELKSEIRALGHRIDSKLSLIDSRFSATDSKLSTMDSKFSAIDSRFSSIDAKLETIMTMHHRTLVLMEEQRNENRIVLDGLNNLTERSDRMEGRIDRLAAILGG
ncbi:MAG: hypothetical protein HYR96_12260 [Deltaproteobacteria bacterium]|nr:hypothetical protein [Deltaproteobacteria bacterium]MBI3296028.1 hypothetical protein [Deltaproteobacteria bacterium]